jgi:hypothetical protein
MWFPKKKLTVQSPLQEEVVEGQRNSSEGEGETMMQICGVVPNENGSSPLQVLFS